MAPQYHILPAPQLDHQLAQLDLLSAMYPDDLTISPSSTSLLDNLRDSPSSLPPVADETVVSAVLRLYISPHDDDNDDDPDVNMSEKKPLDLHLTIPFSWPEGKGGEEEEEEAPAIRVRPAQPDWLSRAETLALSTSTSASTSDSATDEEQEGDNDVLTRIDALSCAASSLLRNRARNTAAATAAKAAAQPDPTVRVWFYFPSISTREKRTDLTTLAPTYSLTGFLYAGKPGLLCLEGAAGDVDAYMRYIRTVSWGDIPAGHKKVSERLREQGVERVFRGMVEITEEVGGRRGGRMNRGDMGAVEEWLGERGLAGQVGRVLM